MSSTARGATRADADFYPTPAWCVFRLLECIDLTGDRWLEPSAGDGAIIRAARECNVEARFTAIELREECRERLAEIAADVRIDNFSTMPIGERWDVCIMNPPFSSAMLHVQRALDCCDQVAVLERLNWLAPASRSDVFRHQMPDIYILPDRPSFTGAGTDSIEYAWFVWKGSRRQVRDTGRVQILQPTPVTDRRGRAPELVAVQPSLFGAA